MSNMLVNADSVLAIDVGAVNTRAVLFDVVEGRYRFLAYGIAQTTAGAPYGDIGEGVHLALRSLQEITGRALMKEDGTVISPAQADGSGVDRCVATLSAGPTLRAVVVVCWKIFRYRVQNIWWRLPMLTFMKRFE
jgi:hypothetical protein